LRTLGLLALLAGSLILIYPFWRQYVHFVSIPPGQGPVIGGALLCLGVAAIWIGRGRD
jgi:hypothetical protein